MIYWIGGSSCSGKSTLAKMLAEKHGLELYSCDDHFYKHVQLISPEKHPAMKKVAEMNPNEAFYSRGLDDQLRVYIQSFQEDFSFVLQDLQEIIKPVIIEGNQLMPSLTAPYIKENHKAIWLIPTEAFQRKNYQKRDWIKGVLNDTEDPEIAFNNWMKRDAIFAEHVNEEAKRLGLKVLNVDGSSNLDENLIRIERLFELENSQI
ncbi:hypothetical protein RFW18_13475 [Metabacillus idriensis]|uniref:hypothetical protein n=1 Tax=Metabacillus idriensis TaxID=324768 RepID=UPI002813C08E|nr:hypothetical protein [Metabacillus idriensis]MDR0138760.1 hypothetical protein [Metabacillus idriensis]